MNIIRQTFRNFTKNTSGNFAVTFAIATIPLFGLAGMAMDYSNAIRIKTKMQAAADAAAISAIVEFHLERNGNQKRIARKYFKANYTAEVKPNISSVLSAQKNEITVNSKGTVPTTLLAILGKKKLTVGASATASIIASNLQIALALDTTGSMQTGGKMSLLKHSARDFIDNILPLGTATSNLVEFAVVPFSTVVKIDTSHASANWMDLNGIAEANFEGCIWDRSADYDHTDSTPIIGDSETYYQASPASLYETTICNSKSQIQPLTQSREAAKRAIGGLLADGNTNTAIGMVWANNVLSDSAPYQNKVDNSKKVIIFLTDGINSNSRQITENGSRVTDVDATTIEACNVAKAGGAIVYAIRVVDGNEAMLKSCASDASKYFSLSHASKLDDTFKEISRQIWNSMIALRS